jgi:hypothetical protein
VKHWACNVPSSDDDRDRSKTPPSGDEPTGTYGTSKPPASTPGQVSPDAALRPLSERFEILNELGRGGMGIVYRARDREAGEIVALKILNPEIASDSTVMERFKNELRLARKITHKNVCRTYDLHRFGPAAAIAMEYVDGESLRHILNRFGGLPLRKGVQVASQISDALKEAHSQSIVHRDLKPENVMLDREGNVKVMDFGIARSIETGTTLTGAVVGTPAYMAPEQAEGKRVDARADIYALGLILYEIFTGIPAFRGDTPLEVALKHIREAPTPPRGVEPTLPEHIERAILKCLEKDPAKRFRSVEELEAALTEKPKAAPAVAEVEQAELPLPLHLARWQRSDYMLLAAALLGALLFFSLFDRALPYSAVRIMPKEEAAKVVRAGLARLGVDASPQDGSFDFASWRYQEIAAMSGPTTARHFLERWGASGGWFRVGGPEMPKGSWGNWSVNNRGISNWLGLPLRPGIFPQGINAQQERDVMTRVASAISAQDLSRVAPRVTSYAEGTTYSYELLDPSLGLPMVLHVNVGVKALSSWLGLDAGSVFSGDWDEPRRAPLVLPLLTLCAAGLFFLRRLHRRPTSWVNFLLALAATTLAFTAFHDALTSAAWDAVPLLLREGGKQGVTQEWIAPLRVILQALLFVSLVALIYCALTAIEYYMRRNDPGRLRTLSGLLKSPGSFAPAALAVLRGFFLGQIFAGAFVVALLLGAHLRLIFPVLDAPVADLAREAEYFSGFNPDALLMGLRSSTLIFLEALFLPLLLLALPTSLLRRVTSRPGVTVGLTILLWLGVAYCPASIATTPVSSLYLGMAVLALFLSVVYLRWDLLTTMAAVFALETWLLGYAVYQMFSSLDSILYALPLMVWLVCALLASTLCVRAQLMAAWRRVAAVFA